MATENGAARPLATAPRSMDDLMWALGLWPGAEPAHAQGTDAEALALMDDRDEAAGWPCSRRRTREERPPSR